MKKVVSLFVTSVLVLGFTACGHTIGSIDLKENQSAIYIKKDGSVSYAVSETFDKDYYDEDELEKKIDDEVADYNQSNQASVNDAVVVEKFYVTGDVATLNMSFATIYDFATYIRDYNNIAEDKFYIGSISAASCEIEGDFQSPNGKETSDAKKIKKMNRNILAVSEQYLIEIDDDVKYISSNCKVDEDGIVTTAKAEDGMSYIVY